MKTLEKWKEEIDIKIDIARNEYIDWNYNILDDNYIEKMSKIAENRVLKSNIKIWVTA
jgi:hypothetical protein